MAGRYAVIMAGGKGERFWPLSTSKHPKQLLALVGDKPLIAQAVDRLEGLVPPENVFVVTNADLVEATREAAPLLPPENIVGEPIGRDTAAAVACGGALVKAKDENGVFAVLTADQVMGDLDVFSATLRGGMELAGQNDILVTIGIEPTFPSTGFGYIESGDKFADAENIEFRKAVRFVEKPDEDTATEYLSTGRFYWNSGMFIWSVAVLEKAFGAHCPEMLELMDTLTGYAKDGKIIEGMDATYPNLGKISVDYALMEKADNIVMACGTFHWDDVGAWPALESHFEQDESGNTPIGQVETLDASGNIILSKDHLTAVIGVRDLIVVQAEGVTLVCPKERAQDIKKMVVALREKGSYDELL
ncbi:Mannose-1-phosphate guanylyltransferase RfbM [Pontiella desulfatans]|uniref:Mannose-1-phosphate guanylyltransferase RfbM n=1 Tax=Pontiella desulfatans TaxID=2750659 RepID=A0A6C2TXI8_PONDE|nr:sugar phosphate nucleotidyltransferase [Pontiella desulfatans]VGO12323.1 Mannose-1-phosphate guanylyltransferase RfbM [Pontiella desulfatans]